MNDFVLLKTFGFADEAYMARVLLETHGIETFLMDEHRNPLANNVMYDVRGIRLQVREKDLIKAIELIGEPTTIDPAEIGKHDDFWNTADNLTRNFPLLNKLKPEKRLLVLIPVIIGTISILIYLLARLGN